MKSRAPTGNENFARYARLLDNAPVDELEARVSEVILLRDIEELTAPEAAGRLDISVDALKSRLHRARAALRDHLLRTSDVF